MALNKRFSCSLVQENCFHLTQSLLFMETVQTSPQRHSCSISSICVDYISTNLLPRYYVIYAGLATQFNLCLKYREPLHICLITKNHYCLHILLYLSIFSLSLTQSHTHFHISCIKIENLVELRLETLHITLFLLFALIHVFLSLYLSLSLSYVDIRCK